MLLSWAHREGLARQKDVTHGPGVCSVVIAPATEMGEELTTTMDHKNLFQVAKCLESKLADRVAISVTTTL
jgi:hypothetical protein